MDRIRAAGFNGIAVTTSVVACRTSMLFRLSDGVPLLGMQGRCVQTVILGIFFVDQDKGKGFCNGHMTQ
jgi:hypothetical protein